MSGEWQCTGCNAEVDGCDQPAQYGWEYDEHAGWLCPDCASGAECDCDYGIGEVCNICEGMPWEDDAS